MFVIVILPIYLGLGTQYDRELDIYYGHKKLK